MWVLIACRRDPAVAPTGGSAPAPAPVVQGYGDLVKQTQRGSATETRTALPCTAAIVVPPRPEVARDPRTHAERDKRRAKLDAMTGTALVREAKPGELFDVTLDRVSRSFDESMTMSRAERDVWLWNLYSGEVNNGGHHQYFFNSSGNDALETRDALARMALPEVLALVDCAFTAFPGDKPASDRKERIEHLARWGDRQFEIFERLDSAFYASSSWRPPLEQYIRAHIAEMPNVQNPVGR
jgi:hypothetical protein